MDAAADDGLGSKPGKDGKGAVSGSGFRVYRGTLLGTPNWEPQEYSRYIIGIYLPGSLYTSIFLLYSWGSLFGVPSRVPLGFRVLGSGFRVQGLGFSVS